MCMKSCAFVTTPNAWCVPRSLSLLTTNSLESTQIVGSSRSAGHGGPPPRPPALPRAGRPRASRLLRASVREAARHELARVDADRRRLAQRGVRRTLARLLGHD